MAESARERARSWCGMYVAGSNTWHAGSCVGGRILPEAKRRMARVAVSTCDVQLRNVVEAHAGLVSGRWYLWSRLRGSRGKLLTDNDCGISISHGHDDAAAYDDHDWPFLMILYCFSREYYNY